MSLTPEREQKLREAARNGGIAFENTGELRALFHALDAERHARKVAEARLAYCEAQFNGYAVAECSSDAREFEEAEKAERDTLAALKALGVEP